MMSAKSHVWHMVVGDYRTCDLCGVSQNRVEGRWLDDVGSSRVCRPITRTKLNGKTAFKFFVEIIIPEDQAWCARIELDNVEKQLLNERSIVLRRMKRKEEAG